MRTTARLANENIWFEKQNKRFKNKLIRKAFFGSSPLRIAVKLYPFIYHLMCSHCHFGVWCFCFCWLCWVDYSCFLAIRQIRMTDFPTTLRKLTVICCLKFQHIHNGVIRIWCHFHLVSFIIGHFETVDRSTSLIIFEEVGGGFTFCVSCIRK